MGGIKIPNFYGSPLYNNQKLTSENTGDKNYNIIPTNRNKFGGTPDNTDKQAAYEKATEELYAEGKIAETDDKAVKLIEKRVKKNAKKLSK